MRKSKDIPEKEWGNAPNLQDWISGSSGARKEIVANTGKAALDYRFSTLKPNHDYSTHFNKARGLRILDCGVNDNVLVISLHGGTCLSTYFKDPRITLVPHRAGMIIDFHEFNNEELVELKSFVPAVVGIPSCLFVIGTDNGDFEYLIEMGDASTLEFEIQYEEPNHA